MRHKAMIFSILAIALATLVISGAAKRPQQTYQGQPTQDPSRPGMQGGMMMGMSVGMMIGQMAAHHDEINETMDKVMQSMNALQNERNERVLRQKMSEHRALLEELRTELNEEGSSLKNMTQMMSGGAPQQTPPPSR